MLEKEQAAGDALSGSPVRRSGVLGETPMQVKRFFLGTSLISNNVLILLYIL
jgi:hypothetical protein